MLEESTIEQPVMRRPTVLEIQKVVTEHYRVPRREFLSDRRTRSLVRARQVAMFLAKKLTLRSLPEIGRNFGGRDHTTVLHAVRKIENEITENPELAEEILELQKMVDAGAQPIASAARVVEEDLRRLDRLADKIAGMISAKLDSSEPQNSAQQPSSTQIVRKAQQSPKDDVDRLVKAAKGLAEARYSNVEKHAIEQVISAAKAFA